MKQLIDSPLEANLHPNHFSIHNAVQAELGCTGEGVCRAYADIFTLKRWNQLGYRVRKGEKGTKIPVFIPITKSDEQGESRVVGKRPKTAMVFCRHQVEER